MNIVTRLKTGKFEFTCKSLKINIYLYQKLHSKVVKATREAKFLYHRLCSLTQDEVFHLDKPVSRIPFSKI